MKTKIFNHTITLRTRRLLVILAVTLITGLTTSCKKFVEIPPPDTGLVNATVFSSDATATSAILGIYSNMMQNHGLASINTSLYGGLSADELLDYSDDAAQREFYLNAINSSNVNNTGLWNNAYQYIYAANAILEGLSSPNSISLDTRLQLLAEAKFVRAFCYFYLTNLYGGVPLITSTDYTSNAKAGRMDRSAIYGQIVKDLKDASSTLIQDYKDANNSPAMERVRPNRYAAWALLARVYLYLGDWPDAEKASDSVINQTGTYMLNTDPNTVFLKNSSETIWQLQPVNPSFDTFEGNVFILSDVPSGAYGTALSPVLINAFEPNDLRRTDWIDSVTASGQTFYFAFKYKLAAADPAVPEYSMVLRLAEQFLIRAESRNEQGNLPGAADDLNLIRNRAGLPNSNAADISSMRIAITHERQTELFTEWGHRWLDLKRTGSIGEILSPIKPNWTSTDSLYPIPITEIKNDPNISQNPGY